MDQSLQELSNELIDVTRQLKQLRPGAGSIPKGITAAEVSALMGVHVAIENGREPRPGLIAEHLYITKSALSQTLKVLEEKDLIERERLKDDSRGVIISIKPAGQAVIDDILEQRQQFFCDLIEHIGEEDLVKVLEIFHKVLKFHEDNGYVHSGNGAPCA